MEMTEEVFRTESENYMGYCKNCKEVTTESVEPDARGYECDECGEPAVMGLEEALLDGLITIV